MIGEKAVRSFGERLMLAMRAVADRLPHDQSGKQTAATLRVIAAIIEQLISKED